MSSRPEEGVGENADPGQRLEALAGRLSVLADALPTDERAALSVVVALAVAHAGDELPSGAERLLDPYEAHHRVTAAERERDPVAWDEARRGWVVTDYEHLAEVERCPHVSFQRRFDQFVAGLPAEKHAVLQTFLRLAERHLGHLDPPEHTRMRRLFSPFLSERRVAEIRPGLHLLVAQVVDQARARPDLDFVVHVAQPLGLPCAGLALGLRQPELQRIESAGVDLAQTVTDVSHGTRLEERAEERSRALESCIRSILEDRRKHPSADPLSDLAARMFTPGGPTDDDTVATCMQIVAGTHAAVPISLSMSLLTLLRHPAQLERLRADPRTIPDAVGELLRYDGIDQSLTRTATEDFRLGGKLIKSGDRVLVRPATANRDPKRFVDPDVLVIGRRARHAAFGIGRHFCPGAQLALAILDSTLTAVLQRWPRFEFRENAPASDPAFAWRHDLLHLPLRFIEESSVRVESCSGPITGGR